MIKSRFLSALVGLGLAACSTGPGPEYYFVSEADVRILEQTQVILSGENKWVRGEETQCDREAKTFTLFCALQKASFDITNDFQLRRPALEEVRLVIDSRSEIALDRRILDFNNLETTDFADIQSVLNEALVRIRARLEASQG